MKQYFPDKTGQLHIRMPSGCENTHKTWTSSNQTKFQHGGGQQALNEGLSATKSYWKSQRKIDHAPGNVPTPKSNWTSQIGLDEGDKKKKTRSWVGGKVGQILDKLGVMNMIKIYCMKFSKNKNIFKENLNNYMEKPQSYFNANLKDENICF